MEYSVEELNMDEVRKFLLDYYESAYFMGIGPAAADYSFVQIATDEELVEFINKAGFNMEEYRKKKITR